MKLKLAVAAILILVLIFALLLVTAGSLWSLAGSAQPKPQAIRIAPAAPLALTTPTHPAIAVAPTVLATVPRSTAATAMPTALPEPTVVPTSATTANFQSVGSETFRLVIPRLGLDIPVVEAPVTGESWQVDHLRQTVGQLVGTADFGADGNAVLAGHVSLDDGSPGPFAQLNQLAPSDVLWLVRGEQQIRYVVDGRQVVAPTNIEVTYPTETARITLITCDGWNEADGRYVNRLVVTGFLVDD